MSVNSELYARLTEGIMEGDKEGIASLAQQALDEGLDPLDVINQGFAPGMEVIGNQFSTGECFLPHLIMAGEAMMTGIAVLKPVLKKTGARVGSAGLVVLGTVEGDIHEIGKNLVGLMLRAGGFEVLDLGVNVPVSLFVEKVRELKPAIVGTSALLTTTMVKQQVVIEALVEAGLRDDVKIMVGGAPITRQWADKIGADGYAGDAAEAVNVAKRLLNIDVSTQGG